MTRLTPLSLLLALAAGCGPGLPPETDAGLAKTSLLAALDAWKEGKPVESLKDRSPPIDIRDISWEKGAKLTDYVVKDETRNGASMRYIVELKLAGATGPSRPTAYNVDAGKMVVIRPDF